MNVNHLFTRTRVYTPRDLAEAIVTRLLTSKQAQSGQWLEPSSGGGIFIDVLAKRGISPDRIHAIDVSKAPLPVDRLAHMLRGVDFIAWAFNHLENCSPRRYDVILGNPPYIPLRKLPSELRPAALLVRDLDEQPISTASNYWYAFLMLSIQLLAPGGQLCFVLPAAWDYANYARLARERLPRMFERFDVYRSVRPLFQGIGDGNIVVLGRGFGLAHQVSKRVEFQCSSSLIQAVKHQVARKPAAAPLGTTSGGNADCAIREIMSFQIGAVTGNTGYFLLSEQQRLELELPREAVIPVLSRSRHLRAAWMTTDEWRQISASGDRCWLFWPTDEALDDSGVQRYIEVGRRTHFGFKVKERGADWYRVRLPAAVHAFASGMSGVGPWLSFRSMPGLTAINTLYTVRFQRPTTKAQRAAWALSLVSTAGRASLDRVRRLYPEGLSKFEPGDLGRVRLPVPRFRDDAIETYAEAIEEILAGRTEAATELADRYLRD